MARVIPGLRQDLRNLRRLASLLAGEGGRWPRAALVALAPLTVLRGLLELLSSVALIALIVDFGGLGAGRGVAGRLPAWLVVDGLSPLSALAAIVALYLAKNALYALALQLRLQLFRALMARLGAGLYLRHLDDSFHPAAGERGTPAAPLMVTSMISAVSHYAMPAINVVAELFVVLFLLGFLLHATGVGGFLVMLVPVGLIGLGYRALGRHNRRHATERMQGKAAMQRWQGDSAAAAREIALSGAGPAFLRRYRGFVDGVARAIGREQMNRDLIFPMSELAGVLGLLLLAGWQSGQGSAVPISLVAYLAIGGRLFPSFRRLATELHTVSSHRVDVENVLALLKPPRPEVAPDTSGRAVVVALRDVGLRHPGAEADQFAHVDLVVAPGEWIAVMGATGAGKSTLLDLLVGRQQPTQGQLHWHAAGRAGVAWLGPTATLLDLDVADNLGFPDGTGHSAAAVREALEIAQAAALVDAMPAGADEPVRHVERQLSTGERQRLALARAVLHARTLLLLDEATAVLDHETERRFFEALRARRPGLAVLIVTHRASTARHADRVLVLSEGRLRAQAHA